MTRRKLKGKRQESFSKSGNKSVVAEEVNYGEAKKNLLEAEFIMAEYKPALQMHPKTNIRDENQTDPWYFTHI